MADPRRQTVEAPPKNAICLSVDRLASGYLGAYGNSWIRTPNFDRLATESIVFDQAMIDSPVLNDLCKAYWHGRHAMMGSSTSTKESTLGEVLRGAGIATTLITDDSEVADLAAAYGFENRVVLESQDSRDVATTVEETHLARFFATAIDHMQSFAAPGLLWLHTSSLGSTWDAPLDFKQSYVAEEDPPPPQGADVPCQRLAEDFDPDELLGLTQAYAGQVTLWDTCLGVYLDAVVARGFADDALLLLLGARGFPLGEHRNVGAFCDSSRGESLYGELVDMPFVMRIPGQTAASLRCPALVQPCDVWATLLNWWEVPQEIPARPRKTLLDAVSEPHLAIRNRSICCGGGGQWTLRTDGWYLRSAVEDGSECELYVKPDDRWEVNEVASRCPDIVQGLTELYHATQEGDWTSELPEELRAGSG